MKKQKEQKAAKTTIAPAKTTIAPARTTEQSPYKLLEPFEEKVIRMRYGLSELDDKTIEYAVGASEDTKLRVTLMEAGNIVELDAQVPMSSQASEENLRQLLHEFKD
ncbi:MAG: hypothetical protein FWC40_01350 [Proteobacteria bacterium]|nr:hypothetical protein [Pseudomonadota bacterium]